MGYSDPLPGSAKRVGGPGDQGIDVVIKRDPLGLDVLYVQAKRYTNGSIGRQDIQAFAGALPGATRGIFVTTSTFTKQAIDNAKQQDLAGKKIILIDGVELSRLMYEHGIGVSAEKSRTYEVKPVDPGFFVEDEAEFGSG
jgi:restriction system protein